MYCTSCGNKLKNNSNYCNKCGKKIINKEIETKTNEDYKIVCMIIGIISIIGAIIFNIIILPLAIIGMIISIKYHQKTSLIMNIIASIISVIIFIIILLFISTTFNFIKKDYNGSVHKYNYSNDDKYDYKYDDDYKYSNEINITGTWYLYADNKIKEDTYYKFNSNKTLTYVTNNSTYTGTYSISNNYSYNNSYTLNINLISVFNSDGSINNNIEKNTYTIILNKDILQMHNLKTNENFNLKKDISTIY